MGINVTITAKFTVERGELQLEDVLECLKEAMEKLREQGEATARCKFSGNTEFTL